ncbi:TPA: helix-turn-helix domain-containing protein [Serratia marcescens]
MADCLSFIIHDENSYLRSGMEALLTGGFLEKKFIHAAADKEIDVAFIRVNNGDSFCFNNFLSKRKLKVKHCVLIKELPSLKNQVVNINCELNNTVIYASMDMKNFLSTVERFVQEGFSSGGSKYCICNKFFFTKREGEVIHYLILGMSVKEISKTLDISEKTVSNHKLNAMKKLNCRKTATFVKHLRLIGLQQFDLN